MKCLFLSASRYSLNNSIIAGLKSRGIDVTMVDYISFFDQSTNKFINKTKGLPKRITNLWMKSYFGRISRCYLKIYNEIRPDLLIVYNNQFLQPDILKIFKEKSKIAFFLGDHPLYTPTANYNLHLLTMADYIITPDSFWKTQLSQMGLKNVVFDMFGFDEEVYHKLIPTEMQIEKHRSDLVYIGSLSKSNWAYKRLMFLDLFRDLDLRVYLNKDQYNNLWREYFPELNDKIFDHKEYDVCFNNAVYNCSRIGPVETVPSIFNGIHVRVIDLLGACVFPLVEYTKDFDMVFDGLDIPTILNYEQGSELARHLLSHDDERQSLIEKMRQRVIDNYSPELVIGRMLESIY